jgi:hypothetical protein
LPFPSLYILWLHSSSVTHLISSYTLFCNIIYQPKNVLNKIQFMTYIKLIRVSAPGCHPQGVFLNKGYRLKALIFVLHYLYSNN